MKVIDKISLKNFKCYSSMEFDLRNLNVLTGINSSGKSTLIQSLLLLRQSYDLNRIQNGLLLNSNLIDLGTAEDIVSTNLIGEEPIIEINLSFDGDEMSNKCSVRPLESDFLKTENHPLVPEGLNLFSNGFNYISSNRIGPQKVYEKSYSMVSNSRSVGIYGELFAHMYQLNKHDNNNTILGDTLENDFARWMSEISPGFSIDTYSDSASQTVELSFKKTGDSKSYKPVNVGFGLSYIAPVLVSLLMSNEGDLIIVESPEAHLHPKGQRKMGELLARISAKGVQIITETHSDHIVNGVRLAVKKGDISTDSVKFMYFYRDEKEHKVDYINVKEDGQLSHWPDGFFDEWDNALFELLRKS